jgi:hypothetical protein
MGYRLNSRRVASGQADGRRRLYHRGAAGVLMPFIGVCVILLMGAAGVVTDLMRNFQTVRELKFAAQTTALYALSLSTAPAGPSGVYSNSSIQNAILTPSIPLSNNAQIGPQQQNSLWTAPVAFAAGDIQFVPNPADISELILRLTARRQGATSVTQFFLPLLFTGLNSVLPQSIRTFDTVQTVEVLGQPATRIGAGPPPGQTAGTRAADLAGCAALPVAISYQQFSSLVAASQGSQAQSAVVDFVSSTSPVPLAGHIPAAFINLSATGGGVNNYGVAQGQVALGQLQALLTYFTGLGSQTASPPASVECGSQVSAYDPADATFKSGQNQAQIVAIVNSLPAGNYVLPVLAGNAPALATTKSVNALNTVIGFAYIQLPKQNISTQPFSLNLTFIPSPPLRNASSAPGLVSWPLGTNNLMPAPQGPFAPRAYDSGTGGVIPRTPGVAMAPALSPRPFNAQ